MPLMCTFFNFHYTIIYKTLLYNSYYAEVYFKNIYIFLLYNSLIHNGCLMLIIKFVERYHEFYVKYYYYIIHNNVSMHMIRK